MAFPAVHLLIAWQAAQGTALSFAMDDYCLGTIAPDAVHMRLGVGSKSECKRQSHLMATGDGREQVGTYWQMAGLTPFTLGYGAHVLADRLWVRFYPAAFPSLMDASGHTIPALYRPDAARVDARLVRERVCGSLLDSLRKGTPPQEHPYVTGDEVIGWRQRVLADFAAAKEEQEGAAPVHMRFADVLAFIDSAGDELHKLLRQQTFDQDLNR